MSTRLVADVAVTLMFYPDTGCLRIADASGICEELRPPHTWRALASALPGWRSRARTLQDELAAVLDTFCRERWAFLASREQARRAHAGASVAMSGRPSGHRDTLSTIGMVATVAPIAAAGSIAPANDEPANDEPLCA